jgi:flagellar L-ring protein FlgH
MMRQKWVVLAAAIFKGWLCVSTMAQQPAANSSGSTTLMPPADRPSVSERMRSSGGSLLKATLSRSPDNAPVKLSAVSFFAVPDPEPKTIKKHDLITIIIREESSISSDGKTDLKKDADLNMQIDEWIKLQPKNFALQGGAQGITPPKITMSGTRNFKGEGKTDRTDTFVARITAEVVDVKPNGTFAVQARKRIKNDEEEQEFILTGICRGGDVTPDNTILSTQIYDLELTTNHKGGVADSNKRGWVPRLMDFVNPF